MSENLNERLKRGEQAMANAIHADAPVERVVGAVRRRRAIRVVTSSAAAFVLVGAGTAGAFAWLPTDQAGPADAAAPSATASNPPTETSLPSPDSGGEQYPASPVMVDGAPALVAASQDVADNTLSPRPGPAFVVGERRALDKSVSPAGLASCADDWCGMAALPAVTPEVLKSGKLTAVIDEWGVLNGGVDPLDDLRYLAVAGPDVGAYLAVDLSAWARDKGLNAAWGVQDLAGDDGGQRIMAVLQEYVSHGEGVDPSMVVMFDLGAGTSTVLAEGMDYASVEWDGTQWRVFGYGPAGTLGARVASDGQSWTTEGMQVAQGWWLTEDAGFTRLYGQNWATQWWAIDGQTYPSTPEGATYCDPAYEASASEGFVRVSCQVAEAGAFGTGSMDNYQLTAGEGWAPLDPSLEAQAPPASTSFGALGDGYVLWRGAAPVFSENGSERGLDIPNVEPIRQYLADGGLWMLGFNELGWLSPGTEYSTLLSFPGDSVSATVYPYGARPAS